LLVLLVAVAAAQYPGVYHGYRTPLAYRGHLGYGTRYGYARYGYPYSAYSHLYRGKRDAEAEPEAEADPGTYVYNTLPYVYSPYVAPLTVKSAVKVPAAYHYSPYYLPYAGAYAHPYGFNPYHPYVLKPVEKEADEPAAATSDEAVEVSRKRREAEAEPEAEAATKLVHVRPYPYTHLSPVTYTHVAPKVVKTYSAPAYTYTRYPYYSGLYGHPGYVY